MKITQAIVFALYYIAIDADDAWADNLARVRINRWSKEAADVDGRAEKHAADAAYHNALNMWRKTQA